jgi:hypothetical protein
VSNHSNWTCLSHVVAIRSVLHPRHKLSYFKNAGWEHEWVVAAEQIVRAEFKRSYEKHEDCEDCEEGRSSDEEGVNTQVRYFFVMSRHDFTIYAGVIKHLRQHISTKEAKRSELRDELDTYLSSDPEYVDDVLVWWSERRRTFPRLSRMALDYLTLPGKCYEPLIPAICLTFLV